MRSDRANWAASVPLLTTRRIFRVRKRLTYGSGVALDGAELERARRLAREDRRGNQDAVRAKNPRRGDEMLLLGASPMGMGACVVFAATRGSGAGGGMRACASCQKFVRRLRPDAPLAGDCATRRRRAGCGPDRGVESGGARGTRRRIRSRFLEFAAFPEKPPVMKPGEDLPHHGLPRPTARRWWRVAITPRASFIRNWATATS